MTSQVQLHMGAVQGLLNMCRADGIYLTPGIKRAIFWSVNAICYGCFGLSLTPTGKT